MNATHISDIKIENFRGFRKLELAGLQAVNLIVGQNNVGKTSLLEAIAMSVGSDDMHVMPRLFRTHSGDDSHYFKWLLAKGASEATIATTTENGPQEFDIIKLPSRSPKRRNGYQEAIHAGELMLGWVKNGQNKMKVKVVSVQHSTPDELVPSFADAVRSPEHQRLLELLLNKVDPRIRDVRLDYEGQPFIALDMGLGERLPLPQAGQGIYRLVSIFAALLGQRPQLCIIDEIENGLHYTVLKQVWKGIAEVSSMLGIQVFATTHSRECVEAAQDLFFNEDPDNKRDFAVIQLMRVKDEVVGRVLNEARIDDALENDIELR